MRQKLFRQTVLPEDECSPGGCIAVILHLQQATIAGVEHVGTRCDTSEKGELIYLPDRQVYFTKGDVLIPLKCGRLFYLSPMRERGFVPDACDNLFGLSSAC